MSYDVRKELCIGLWDRESRAYYIIEHSMTYMFTDTVKCLTVCWACHHKMWTMCVEFLSWQQKRKFCTIPHRGCVSASTTQISQHRIPPKISPHLKPIDCKKHGVTVDGCTGWHSLQITWWIAWSVDHLTVSMMPRYGMLPMLYRWSQEWWQLLSECAYARHVHEQACQIAVHRIDFIKSFLGKVDDQVGDGMRQNYKQARLARSGLFVQIIFFPLLHCLPSNLLFIMVSAFSQDTALQGLQLLLNLQDKALMLRRVCENGNDVAIWCQMGHPAVQEFISQKRALFQQQYVWDSNTLWETSFSCLV